MVKGCDEKLILAIKENPYKTILTTDRTAIEYEKGLKTVAGPEEHKWVTQYA